MSARARRRARPACPLVEDGPDVGVCAGPAEIIERRLVGLVGDLREAARDPSLFGLARYRRVNELARLIAAATRTLEIIRKGHR